MAQREITTTTELLDANGILTANRGYCKRNLYIYDRDRVRNKSRLKEWDFYQISDGNYVLQVNFANIWWGAAATASIFKLDGKRPTKIASGMKMQLLPGHNKCVLSSVSDRPNKFEFKKKGFTLSYEVTERERTIIYDEGDKLSVKIVAAISEGSESITIATPFKNKKRFFLTDKINCMPVTTCDVVCNGKAIAFDMTKTFMVLDWGRGAWPYSNYWYWANMSTRLADGKLFGFELTWGIGDDSDATETMLFYDGKGHKIGRVALEREPDGHWLEPWHFISDDGRLDLTMTPECDNYNPLNLILIKFSGHQVHGKWNGKVILDDGKAIEVIDEYAFCEKIYNRW